jgi:hypothetical protein
MSAVVRAIRVRVKARAYGVPILAPRARVWRDRLRRHRRDMSSGRFSRLADALDAYGRSGEEVAPDPAWVECCGAAQGVF